MAADVVVVTGSAGGIGSAIADRLLGAGLAVIGIDQMPSASRDRYRHICMDLAVLASDHDARARLEMQLADVLASLGDVRISGLVNNAAAQVVHPAATLATSDFRRSLDVNVTAPLVLAQILFPQLAACHGAIINISSIHARLTKPEFSAYSTSKAALSGLSRALAVEWGSHVRVATIELAAVATPMLEDGFAGRASARAQLDAMHPSGAIGQPGQVAEWVYQMLAAKYPFANGTVLCLDGGISFRLFDPN